MCGAVGEGGVILDGGTSWEPLPVDSWLHRRTELFSVWGSVLMMSG